MSKSEKRIGIEVTEDKCTYTTSQKKWDLKPGIPVNILNKRSLYITFTLFWYSYCQQRLVFWRENESRLDQCKWHRNIQPNSQVRLFSDSLFSRLENLKEWGSFRVFKVYNGTAHLMGRGELKAEIISINQFRLPHAFMRLRNSCACGVNIFNCKSF